MLQFIPLLGPIIDKLVDRIPDPNERAAAKEAMEQSIISAANANVQGQIDINKVEASHASVFVAGWRPFLGWTCGFAFFWEALAYPMLTWAATSGLLGPDIAVPVLPTNANIMELTLGMLGIAGMRTWEKSRGLDTRAIR